MYMKKKYVRKNNFGVSGNLVVYFRWYMDHYTGNKDPKFRKRSLCTVHSEIREQIPADLLDELLSKLELGTVQIRVSYVRSVAYQYW